MRLKISDLRRVVDATVQEKKATEAFCNEVKRVFGPTVDISDDIGLLSERANERLDVLERTGRLNYAKFSPQIALNLSHHEDTRVRRLVARLLPESSAVSFINDPDPLVRFEAAKKSPTKVISKALKLHENDYLLREVLEDKLLNERADSALDSAAEGPVAEEFLSDWWYQKTAKKLFQDYYHRGLDTGWVPNAVKQVVIGNRATNRFNIDPQKLMKAVVEMIADREEERLEELQLKESRNFSSRTEFYTSLLESDPVEELLEINSSSQEYVQKANQVFSIKESAVPPGIKKYSVGENKSVVSAIPVVGFLPHKSGPRYSDEVALDTYVKHWNGVQSLRGEPYKLSWSPHPDALNKISFRLELK